MSDILNKFRKVLPGVLLGMLMCSHVSADDIEIYVGLANGVATKPNVLFLLDNSGSMRHRDIRNSPKAYSFADTYPSTFPSGFYYWTTDGSIPTDPSTDNKVAVANFKCETAVSPHLNVHRITPLTDHGIYTDKALAWRLGATNADNAWSDLEPHSAGAEDIECMNDAGVHGNGGGQTYPVNGASGPWGNINQALDWDEAALYYTFYTAHYLDYAANTPTLSRSRFTVMVDVVDTLLKQVSNVNLGILWLNSNDQGGYIDHEVVDIDDFANRLDLLETVHSDPEDTATPLSETMYEGYLYYSGGPVTYGEHDNTVGDSDDEESVDAAREPTDLSRYNSPIQFECQQNYLVVLTDGQPSRDADVNTIVPGLPDFFTRTGAAACDGNAGVGIHGVCLDDLAAYMNFDDVNLAPTIDGPHSIQTFTIGFQINNPLLQETSEGIINDGGVIGVDADGGGGRHYSADNSGELANAFNDILENVTATPSTFTAPSVAVNAFNSVLNREFLYYTMFLPSINPRWEGNLKKYRLVFENNGAAYISDSSTAVPPPDVIDPATGNFTATANSYWNSITDGPMVTAGGFRARLTDGKLSGRRVWTDVGLATSADLSNRANRVIEGTGSPITRTMLGVGTDAEKDDIVQWMRGVDVFDSDNDTSTTDSRRSIGDPLHSQPRVVTYGGNANSPKQVIFFTTNDGYLHALDEETGDEIFTYIPEEMLSVQPPLYDNIPLINRPYGLDGSVSTWVYDHNEDGVIDPVDDHVYIYFGMRRGGRNYYALDVTKIMQATPSATLLWKIVNGDLIAGSQGTDTAGIYSMMGQTWSQPLVRTVKIGTQEKTILAIGGGYDTNQDLVTVRTADTVGRAIYFVNAATGAREWWMSSTGADLNNTQMLYSIPAKLAAYDTNGDGLLDRVYFGDMGAQLWRLDVDNGQSAAQLVSGGVIASVGGTAEEDARRFYSPPDAALVSGATGSYIGLVIGSGYRAHPLNIEVLDRLYLIKDPHVFSAPSSYTTLSESDLYDATANTAGEGTGQALGTAKAALAAADGWYISLDENEGEKSLSAPLILNGVAIMTTFAPTQIDACRPGGGGEGAVYYLNLADATPVFDFDGVGGDDLTRSDRRRTLASPGIPPETAYIVGENADGLVSATLHDKEQGEDVGQNAPQKTYWYEQ